MRESRTLRRDAALRPALLMAALGSIFVLGSACGTEGEDATGPRAAQVDPFSDQKPGPELGQIYTAIEQQRAHEIRDSLWVQLGDVVHHPERIGSIDVGKDADFMVLEGHPFDYRVLPQMVFIDGELVFSSRRSDGTLGGLILEGQSFEDRDAECRSRHPFRSIDRWGESRAHLGRQRPNRR